ncbi:MAG: hypothetical protein HYU36_24350 [Planctomycetes bacterium]|nr:hypothetical protein [Planctomycetota bacterium]
MTDSWKARAAVASLLYLCRALGAESGPNLTLELYHVGESMVAVSTVVAATLKVHREEKSMCTYASKIAAANLALVKMMKPPKEAETLHAHLRGMAEHFSKAVDFYGKGDFQAADEEGQDFWKIVAKAKAEIDQLKRKGILPP